MVLAPIQKGIANDTDSEGIYYPYPMKKESSGACPGWRKESK
jgi:hypothetical protein